VTLGLTMITIFIISWIVFHMVHCRYAIPLPTFEHIDKKEANSYWEVFGSEMFPKHSIM